jgi:glycosyltransferase involved in cell wall biosynthesis
MDKLRVGVIVDQDYQPVEGGGYSYYNLLLQGINNYNFHPDIEIINLVFYSKSIPQLNLKKETIFIPAGFTNYLKTTFKKKTSKYSTPFFTRQNPILNYFATNEVNKTKKKAEQLLKHNKIDLIYYLKPELDVLDYPFIATHWDIGHKSMDAFPEVVLHGAYEKREKYYLYTLNKAFAIICESETGARELKRHYSLYENKIKVVPIFGAESFNLPATDQFQSETLKRYNLEKDNFYVYPSMFWPHKNHYHLILAFNKLVQENNNQELKLMLCGSDKGNMAYIQQLVKSLSLTEQVIIPGFVAQDELSVFYKNALALTMASYLGPTNMPLIEAAHLNCPVLCSGCEGHKEILGNNALYFDPSDVNEIETALHRVLDKSVRDELKLGANEYIRKSPFNLDNSLQQLEKVLLQTKSKRRTWGIDD